MRHNPRRPRRGRHAPGRPGRNTGTIVLAIAPDGEAAGIGPVYAPRAVEALKTRISEAGWTYTGTARHLTLSEFGSEASG
jgi:hypothetical protein